MSREEAEEKLRLAPVGSFIVRESVSKPQDFSVSVRLRDDTSHIKVRKGDVGVQHCSLLMH
jgi:hypothetical protein